MCVAEREYQDQMSYQGRSLDDLPLAAYSRGTVEPEPEEDVVAEPPHLSQQDAVAMAMGMEPAPKQEVEPAPDAAAADAGRRGPSLPRFSMPRFSLPRLALPKPRMAVRGGQAAAVESPFQAAPQQAMSVAHVPAPPAAARVPAAAQAGATTRRGASLGDLSGIGASLRNPRTAVRDPKVLFGGMIAIGVVVVGLSLLGGASGGIGGPGASASAPAGAGATGAPGAATVLVSGREETLFTLTGTAGFGRPSGPDLASTWSDAVSGATLSLTGRVGSVTRTTNADLVLTVIVPIGGVPVTFVSQAGECTIGMAEKVFSVTGSFNCPEVVSEDGRVELKITGSYQT